MNKTKLERYLASGPSFTEGYIRQVATPILLTDSKGDYLSEQSENCVDNSIVWLGGKGWTSTRGLEYFRRKCRGLKERYDNSHLFVWLGTCDLTTKNRKYVYLNENYSRDAAKLMLNLRKFSNLARRENLQITVLEIPVFCIRAFNKYHGHREAEIFEEQDKNLHLAIECVNKEIRKINRSNIKISPKFNCDLQITRKNNSKYNKYRFNFSQFRDGIHPNPLLSKYWLRRISEIVDLHCFTHQRSGQSNRLRDGLDTYR